MDECLEHPPVHTAASYQTYAIELDDVRYPFLLGYGALEDMWSEVERLDADRILLVTDDRVEELYGAPVARACRAIAPTLVLSLPAGEQSKTPDTLISFARAAVDWGATRRSIVVTLGGGVPGNLGGLLAGLLFRGIRFVHVPTTLMAMSDSVISLKQAVNLGASKNVFGTYHPPEIVLADPELLETLPEQHWRSGICEAVKNALAIRPEMQPRLLRLLRQPLPWPPGDVLALIIDCLDAKLHVMRHDHRERRTGLVLEYGHTVGHAIEMAERVTRQEGTLSHGEAVALGMLASAVVSQRLEYSGAELFDQHLELIVAAGVRPQLPQGVDAAAVMEVLPRDNKRGYLRRGHDDAIGMILLRAAGEPLLRHDQPLTPVPMPVVREAVTRLSTGF